MFSFVFTIMTLPFLCIKQKQLMGICNYIKELSEHFFVSYCNSC